MKKYSFFALAIVILFTKKGETQNVGIGTNSPSPAAKLEVYSINSGVLIPRLTTAQKTSIASPPAGLMVYDNTKKLISFYNGTQWTEMESTANGIWGSNVANSETYIFNNVGVHTYVSGYPMKPVSDPGTIDGVLRLEHGSESPLTTKYFLSMDGRGIQGRTNGGCLACATVEGNLLLNRYGGNVGIGLLNPSRAKLELNGVGIGTTAAIIGGDGTGISLQRNPPVIGYNEYFDGVNLRYIWNGYAASEGVNQQSGNYELDMLGTGSANAGVSQFIQAITVSQNGNVGMGIINPDFRLSVTDPGPLYSGIEAKGKGFTSELIDDGGVPYTLYTHEAAIKAIGEDEAVALEIDGPVAVPGGSNKFIFEVNPQNNDPAGIGYYYSLGNGYWAILLNGNGSVLNNMTFPTEGYLFVQPWFSWSEVSSTFNIPSKEMLWYDFNGQIKYVIDTEPAQVAKPIIRLRVLVVRRNPDAI